MRSCPPCGIWKCSTVFRSRCDAAASRSHYRDASLDDLRSLVIAIDPGTNRHAWSATLRLCDRFGLTPYDAAYLELAQRRQLPLATLDGELIRAAQTENVPLAGAT